MSRFDNIFAFVTYEDRVGREKVFYYFLNEIKETVDKKLSYKFWDEQRPT